MSQFNLTLFLLGCVGGLLPDALRIIRNRYKKNIPAYLKRLNFWLGVMLWAAIGGLVAWVLGATQAKDALIFGYAAPQLLSQLGAEAWAQLQPADRGAKGPEDFSLPIWWAS